MDSIITILHFLNPNLLTIFLYLKLLNIWLGIRKFYMICVRILSNSSSITMLYIVDNWAQYDVNDVEEIFMIGAEETAFPSKFFCNWFSFCSILSSQPLNLFSPPSYSNAPICPFSASVGLQVVHFTCWRNIYHCQEYHVKSFLISHLEIPQIPQNQAHL